MDSKIDIHHSDKVLSSALRSFEASDMNATNKEAVKGFLREARLGKFGRGAGSRKLIKYLYVVRTVNSQLGNRPFGEISEEEYLDWFERIKNGEIVSDKTGKPFSSQTLNDFVKDFKTFMSWFDRGVHFYKLKWFRVSPKVPRVPAISLDQMKEIISKVNEPELKFYLALSFDTGARPEEVFNLRVKDFRWLAEVEGGAYWANFRHVKGDDEKHERDIPCPLFTEIYNDYAKSFLVGLQPDDTVMRKVYVSFHRRLKELEREGVVDHITHYKIRHSSWTYWGNLIKDKFKLNKRMGERLNSDMADRYIDDSKVSMSVAVVEARRDEVETLRDEIRKLKETQAGIDLLLSSDSGQKLFKMLHKLQKEVGSLKGE